MNIYDYKNPPNHFHEAKFEAWLLYTEAYHSNAPKHTQEMLYRAYQEASKGYENNPQTIFSDENI